MRCRLNGSILAQFQPSCDPEGYFYDRKSVKLQKLLNTYNFLPWPANMNLKSSREDVTYSFYKAVEHGGPMAAIVLKHGSYREYFLEITRGDTIAAVIIFIKCLTN